MSAYLLAMTSNNAPDPLDPARDAVLEEALADAPFDGWTGLMLRAAAARAGEAERLPLLFPQDVRDLLDFWADREDRATLAAFEALNPKPHGITARLTCLVRDRIARLSPDREAVRRAAATQGLPGYAALGSRLTWRTANRMWRAVGDEATDFNHYSKRAILSGVYASTFARWLGDEGDGEPDPYQETWDFLDRRIADVMKIERAKARAKTIAPDVSGLVAALGRLRYGSK